jgi:methylmalonyl-CoA mutase N-terminal domain/subunit
VTIFNPSELRALAKSLDAWGERHADAREEARLFETISGRPVRRVYTPLDLEGGNYLRDLGLPGDYPYTRGVHATGYRGKLWTMRMFAGFGDAEDTNARFRRLLAEGQTGLSTAFDMPTLYGLDTDDPRAEGEFGTCGVAVGSLADMATLFGGIPLDEVSVSMTINSPAAAMKKAQIAAAEGAGVPRARLRGTLQNDILKEFIAQNEHLYPIHPSMRLVVDTIEFAARELPQWNPVSVSGYHIREAGATAAQELAFTLADGFAYVEACLERGLEIDSFAPRLSFFFNSHSDFFEEIAKFRAARRIWARHLKERYGARDPRSLWLRFHTQTAGCSLTAQQPLVNVVRTALQALAGVLGGTNSLHTNSLDEVLSLPTEAAATLALRTLQVIAHESGVANTVDPLAGSYFLERLTDEIEEAAEAYFRRIAEFGGMVAAVEAGFPQREIADAAYHYQQEIDRRERLVVGVNAFANEGPEAPAEVFRIDPAAEERHLARLRKVRTERDGAATQRALSTLARACDTGENVMPPLLDCARAHATLGDISAVFRDRFGEALLDNRI